VWERAGLIFTPNEIVIPVRNIDGVELFRKYRRSFHETNGPKYRYEFGATASLFGMEQLKNLAPESLVIVVEGEFDALALRTLGYVAVSTTGGAKTWRKEWGDMLLPFDVVLAYDADTAGIEGMLNVASITPNASIAWIPVQYGKDHTEIIHAGHSEELRNAIDNAKTYSTFIEADTRLTTLRAFQRELVADRQRVLMDPNGTPFHIDIALVYVQSEATKNRVSNEKRQINPNDSEIEKAKGYPIRNLMKVNKQGMTKCLWHNDNTPSMKLYADGHLYCFVCGKRADAIDIYRMLHTCDFRTALKFLST